MIANASWERYEHYTQNIRQPEEFITLQEAENKWKVDEI